MFQFVVPEGSIGPTWARMPTEHHSCGRRASLWTRHPTGKDQSLVTHFCKHPDGKNRSPGLKWEKRKSITMRGGGASICQECGTRDMPTACGQRVPSARNVVQDQLKKRDQELEYAWLRVKTPAWHVQEWGHEGLMSQNLMS